MNPVYLSRIEIENFRTYGEDFKVELNPVPGVTLVCGMNGLGKTGFFEALEWALTGDVRRLSEKRKDQLDPVAITRSGAPESSHRVLVQWGGYTLERQGNELKQGADLSDFLRQPSWQPQISDVATYLRLTHFLPQASASRFTMLDEPTRWGLLKGPAGVERLERLRLLINDKRARNAFADAVARVKTECDGIERKIADWNEAIERRRQLRGFAQAAAAISPAEIIEMLAGPWELLSKELSVMPTSDESPHGVAARMGILRERIELHRGRLIEINTKLPYLEEVLNNLVAQTARRAEAVGLIQRTETETKVLAEAWSATESALRALRNELRAREEEFREGQARSLQLQQLTETDLARQAATASLGVQTKREEALQAKVAECDARLASARSRVETYQRNVAKQHSVADGMKRVGEARGALTAAQMAEEQAAALSPQIAELTKQVHDGRSELSRLDAEVATRDQEIAEKKVHLDQEREAVGQLAHAVAMIVSHLKTEDSICPVCAQVHPPGTLQVEGHKSVARWNQGAARLVEELSRLVAARDVRAKERSAQQEVLKAIEARLNALIVAQNAVRPVFSQVTQRYGLQAQEFAEAFIVIEAQQESLNALQQQIQLELAGFSAPALFEAEVLNLEFEARRAKDEHEAVVREISTLRGTLESHNARLSKSAALINGAGGIESLATARGGLLRNLADLEARLCDLNAKVAAEEQKANELRTRLAVARLRAADATLAEDNRSKQEKALLQAWGDTGLGIEPTIESFHEWRRGKQTELQLMERALATVIRAVEGLNNWLKLEELRTAEQMIRDTFTHAGSANEDEYAKRLDQMLVKTRSQLQAAMKARNRAEDIAGSLKETSDTFSKSALEPLSDRITDYLRLISPFDYTYKIAPHLTDTRARAVDRLGIPNPQSGEVDSKEPDLWLSEGQQSVLGLSVLLGASTSYRWSRWRALLLDDPLQSADLIHTAAFADVIRGLVRDKGYQIIISTHDYEEAEFLKRKCNACNIPAQRITLLSLGPTGVRFRADAPTHISTSDSG
jgi:exonuclease SbcC